MSSVSSFSSVDSSAADAAHSGQWQFWVDRGGTFTDIVALTPAGELITHKLLSENPQHYADAAVEGIRQLQARYPQYDSAIASVKMGTTVATNALLERKGARTLLCISKGLRDQLRQVAQQPTRTSSETQSA